MRRAGMGMVLAALGSLLARASEMSPRSLLMQGIKARIEGMGPAVFRRGSDIWRAGSRGRGSKKRDAGLACWPKRKLVKGPHSEPMVHVRRSDGTHDWHLYANFDDVVLYSFPECVIEQINGYGQVTRRVRVTI